MLSLTLIERGLDLLCLAGLGLVAVGLGRVVLSLTNLRFVSKAESAVFGMALGLGLMSHLVFVLAAFQILYRGFVYGLIAVCAVLALFGWSRQVRYLPDATQDVSRHGYLAKAFVRADRALLVVLCVVLVLALLLVLTPAICRDALIYHLAVPTRYLAKHGFHFIDGNVFANYPLGAEMLYITGLSLRADLGGDVLSKGIHFVMGLSILAGMYTLSKRHFQDSCSRILPLVLFYTIPSVFVVSHRAYSDLTLSLYAFLAVYCFINWLSAQESGQDEQGWIALCGSYTGFALSAKYTALFMPFLAFFGLLWAARRYHGANQGRAAVRLVWLYMIFTILVGCPFYIKNWWITGNPLYPFLHKVFGGKGWDSDQAHLYDVFVRELGMGRRLVDYLMLPWNLSLNARFDSIKFDGIIGPLFLVTLPFLIGIRTRISLAMKVVAVYCISTFFFWAGSAQQVRYLIPIFPWLALVVGRLVDYYRNQKWVLALLSAALGVSVSLNLFDISADFFAIRPIEVIMGRESRDHFLRRMIPGYQMYSLVNTRLPQSSKVFLIHMKNFGFLCKRDYYSDSMFETYTLQKILRSSTNCDTVFSSLKTRGVTHLLYNVDYVLGKMSVLSNEEKSRFVDFQQRHLRLLFVGNGRYFLCEMI